MNTTYLYVIDGQGRRLRPAHDRAPAQFGARRDSPGTPPHRRDVFAGRMIVRAVSTCARRQAFAAVVFLAREHLWIEMTSRRIADEAVLDAVERVAGVEHGAVDHRVLLARDERRRILQRRIAQSTDATRSSVFVDWLARRR